MRKFSDYQPEAKDLVMDMPLISGATSENGAVIPTSLVINKEILAATANEHIFIAPFACKVVSIREIHSVVGGTSAAVAVRKITDTSAPNASAGSTVKELLSGTTFSLTSTANTVVSGGLSATASDLAFAVGDHIAINFSGTLTGLVGSLTIELQVL